MRTTAIEKIVKKVIETKIRRVEKMTMENTGGGQTTTATAVESKHTLGKNAQQKTIRVIFAIYRATGPECATKENKEGKIGGITKIETPITEIVKMTIRE